MDWNDFAKRLTVALLRLPVRAFLIVEVRGGLPYAQAMRTEEDLRAETVGSAFLPRPLSAGQERRLAALGWQRPDEEGGGDDEADGGDDEADGAAGEERRNWWHRFEASDGSKRGDRRFAEECAILAGMIVGAFRDVHGLSSPRELVYQAARTGPDAGALALPGLGIPAAPAEEDAAAAPVVADAAPPTDVEKALADARARGDQDAYLRILTEATLYLPAPGGPQSPAGGGRHYATARFGEGTYVLAFTSPEAMDASLHGQAVHHRTSSLAELARHWPHPDWRLAVNPGLPSAAYLDAPAAPKQQSATPPGRAPAQPGTAQPDTAQPDTAQPDTAQPDTAQPGTARPDGAQPGAAQLDVPRPRVEEPASGRGEAPSVPPQERATDATVMQKVVRPDHVVHYLEGGYDLVAGYVHRLQDVQELNTPARLVRGLGLVWEGSPFSAADEAIHVIRWPAVRPALFRRPLGGIDEWSMGIIPGGWVIEKAPFHGSGYASGEGPAIPEFKVDSVKLPHGAELWRIDRSGEETLVAVYDADLRRWTRRDGEAAAFGRPPRQRAGGR